ncbi:hypothetical protein B0H34DRAFT_650904 [Crassisporium funariophilum]|nr:hypothetical protein B0H34DRAFT_650904 [Crassisporium funariophilum]
MASPHSHGPPPYPHPGAGPSSYYQHSTPPPHHIYGTHSPGPRPNYHYPYPGMPPPQPHMNSHQPAPYQQSPAQTRGNPRGGSYGARSVPHYPNHNQHAHSHNYHPQQQQQQQAPYQHSHVSPVLGVHPQHAGQHIPYSPQSAKYNQQPYSPAYHYPSPTAPVFTPSWQTQQQQQPLSPLPKQLFVPQPQNIQAFYESPPAPQQEVIPTPQAPAKSPEPVVSSDEPQNEPSVSSPRTPSPTPSSPAPASPAPTPAPHSSSYSQMGTISTSDSVSLSSLPSSPASSTTILNKESHVTPSRKHVSNPIGQWAIWSRRPQDPSHAPSIIISPRARPPPDVIQQALDMNTPPPSPPSSSPAVVVKTLPPSGESAGAAVRASTPSITKEPPSADDGAAAWSSQTESSVPSSAVTETTDTPTVPVSPASSNTSLSIGSTPVKVISTAAAPTPAASVPSVTVSAATAASSTSVSVNITAPVPVVPSAAPSTAVSVPLTSSTSAPPSAPSTPTPAPAKKSWASLLRPATSSSTPNGTRSTLPTSSVVGFSIPAADPSSANPTVPVSPTKKSELLALLTGGHGAAAAAAMRIRPRGLVNSGNMCFANSVLQVLVYCPPFSRLFAELGRVLVGPVVGNGVCKEAGGVTPLVDATIEFLREFSEKKKKKAKSKTRPTIVVGNRGGSAGANGKGKAKESDGSGDDEDDDWDGESFLPGYVYDAMKLKKRFDNMRGGHQEDAEEFFGFYLDTLEEELLSILHSINPPSRPKVAAAAPVEEKEEAAPPEDDGWLEVGKRNRMVVTRTIKATESPITRIFGGKFRSTLRAPGQKDSVIVEDWRSLRLDIQRDQIHTIQDALSYISHPQPVQLTQPARPGVTIEAQQQVLIEALPPILVLHIKRFCYDTNVGGVVKVGKQVRFGPELEIGADIMVPAAKKAHPARYKLFGALYHHGLSASGGHYTLDILHPNRYPSANPHFKPREGWVRIDDELVSDVRNEDVFGAYERDDARCAYLLFYRRI